MWRRLIPAAGAVALTLSGCADDDRGGPLGIVAFSRIHQVSAAEPLFGRDEDRCLDSPAFLLSIFNPRDEVLGTANIADIPERLRQTCAELRISIRNVLSADFEPPGSVITSAGGGGDAASPGTQSTPLRPAARYGSRQRNEVVDALVAASNRKCGRYIAFLQTYDGNINNTFGILSLIAGGLTPIIRGDDTARTLGGLSAIFSGTRSTINETHFRNRTIALLATAFEHARQEQRREITNLQQCTVSQYSLMRGLEDAFRYHATCSIVSGLDEATRAVERANAPDIATMQRMMEQYTQLRTEVRRAAGLPLDETTTDGPQAGGQPGTTTAPGDPIDTGNAEGTATTDTTGTNGTTEGTANTDATGTNGTTEGTANTGTNRDLSSASAPPPSCPFTGRTTGSNRNASEGAPKQKASSHARTPASRPSASRSSGIWWLAALRRAA